jgi:hypothetical protein
MRTARPIIAFSLSTLICFEMSGYASEPSIGGTVEEPCFDGSCEGSVTSPEVPNGPRADGVPEGIINGESATLDDYPMTGGLLMDATIDFDRYGTQSIASFLCSSTLIAPDVVLLAAHCVDEFALTYGQGTVESIEFRWSRQEDLESFGPRRANWPEDAVLVRAWVAHERFSLFGLQMGLAENYDIALVFLDSPVLDVAPALLPSPDENAALEEGTEVVVVGWGQQTATSGYQAPPAGTFGHKMMGTSFIAQIDDPEMQIGAVEGDVRKCHGDSGGPTFVYYPDAASDDTMRLVGVTSHAYDSTDCDRKGGVDTRVGAYLEWIDAEMRAACEDGTRVWCDEPGILPSSWNDLPEEEVADSEDLSGDESKEQPGGCNIAAASRGPSLIGLGIVGMLGLFRRRR